MDPNEYNEYNENNENMDQQSVPHIPEEEIPAAEEMPAAPAGEIPQVNAEPAATQEPQPTAPVSDSTYHGAGAGRKESPYASSPYYTARQTRSEGYDGPAWEPGGSRQEASGSYTCQPQPTPKKEKKPRKALSKTGRNVIAAILAVCALIGSSSITAALVNEHWEEEMDRLEDQMEDRIERLEEQLDQLPGQAVITGQSLSDGGLTPSQVYAMNVNSVVSISNYATVSTQLPFFGGSSSQQQISSGSGFIISADGYVITNYHVVEGNERLTVSTSNGDEYDAQLIGSDEINDVALLKVEAESLDSVTIGSSDELIVGDMVVAIGNPLGAELSSTQTVGYISGKDRAITTDGSIINMLQTDAAINSGNSGGPLFNMKGEVVGITSAKYSGSSSSGASIEGIGFAIPIDDVMKMIDDLRDYGYLKNQAYLGVEVMDMDSETASMYSLPRGSYVAKVVPGGSADRAGVQEKDIIIAVGEHAVNGNSELTVALRRFRAGDTTTITVFRSGQELELPITFDEKPGDLNTQPTEETLPGEMPQNGSYEEWYDYFSPYFGDGEGNG